MAFCLTVPSHYINQHWLRSIILHVNVITRPSGLTQNLTLYGINNAIIFHRSINKWLYLWCPYRLLAKTIIICGWKKTIPFTYIHCSNGCSQNVSPWEPGPHWLGSSQHGYVIIWISNFIPYILMYVITHPCWDYIFVPATCISKLYNKQINRILMYKSQTSWLRLTMETHRL